MSKYIVESFMYCATSWELWIAIQARYGWSNGPMIYQLQREISTVSQQDLDLSTYLTKLRNRRMVQTNLEVNSSHVAYQATLKETRREGDKLTQKKNQFTDKRNLVCPHCCKTGHAQESCFQLHGIPEWYKTLNDKKKKWKAFVANVDVKDESTAPAPSRNVTNMMAELLKVLQKSTTPTNLISNYANYAHFDEEFADPGHGQFLFQKLYIYKDSHAAFVDAYVTFDLDVTCSTSIHFFDLIHMDLWGPYTTHTISEEMYNSMRISSLIPDTQSQSSSLPLPAVPLSSDNTSSILIPQPVTPASTSATTLPPITEPKSFLEAVKCVEWQNAMKTELDALERNQTWKLTNLPVGKRPIGLAKTVTVRLFLALATAYGWPVHQLDVNNAFLHGHLDEELYMTPPEGYCVRRGLVCKLERLPTGIIALLVYVDDILVTAPTLEAIKFVKDYLHSLFTIKDLGDARYFLGFEIARNSTGVYVAQTKYILDIIQDIGMTNAKPVSTPLPLGLKLNMNSGALLPSPDQYRRLIGRLLYLCFTQPDISHSVQQLSQYLTGPMMLIGRLPFMLSGILRAALPQAYFALYLFL
ncbi:UNVERIFIED_CONTAM: putative mitochondrial protein [Sesamum radiatum]|uniref:Mitochondrial protein n=1 Tax=Sesamum radiatum TaxID=300843 RepID=A0AAW2PH84_SESRA